MTFNYICSLYFLRYDDYGPPPERGYPSRDYDRGGYSERDRERPPSYGNDHYASRYRHLKLSFRQCQNAVFFS